MNDTAPERKNRRAHRHPRSLLSGGTGKTGDNNSNFIHDRNSDKEVGD